MWSLFASKLPFSWEAGCRVLTWLVNTPWWPPPPAVQSPNTTGLPWVGEVSGEAEIEMGLDE